MHAWTGKPISPGFAEGAAVVYSSVGARVIPRCRVPPEAIEAERDRLRAAMAAARDDVEELRREVAGRLGEADAAIFATHAAFLADSTFRDKIEQRIAADQINAEQAVEAESSTIIGALAGLADEYLRERANDVRDVARRVVDHLLQTTSRGLAELPPDAVVVARELLPSETARLDRRHVRAIVTEQGSKTSHSAILAKALGIPAVTALNDICACIEPGARLLVDGCAGTVTMNPTEAARAAFEQHRDAWLQTNVPAAGADPAECMTADGTHVQLLANIGRIGETADVRAQHMLGVGLFRTEVLFLESAAPPSFQTQREAYRSVAEQLDGLPLVIRTFDLGGDKHPRFLPPAPEHNPNIGLRGLRFALRERTLLRTQLEAILDVARTHPVQVLFPMVVAGDDLQAAIEVLHDVARERGHAPVPPVGAMIETPSSVFALPEITAACDFLSIGSNDLTQFILAADRDAADLLDDFSILHPSVLRAVDMIVRAAAAADRPLTVCGEAAGDPEIVPLLVGLGVRRLSMSPVRAPRVRLAIRRSHLDVLQETARDALRCSSVEGVLECIRRAAAPA